MGADATVDATPSQHPAELLPWWGWLLLALASVVILAALGLAVFWGPEHLVGRDQLLIPGKVTPDTYLKAITDTRTTLVQSVGGFALSLGVVVGLLTLLHNRQTLRASRAEHLESLDASRQALQETLAFNRESLTRTVAVTERGQITERFAKGIEQLGRSGTDALDLRLGGIYALEQIARDSPDWHNPVIEVLAAFVRVHASGKADPEGASVQEQVRNLLRMAEGDGYQVLPADISAALDVLARRDRSKDARKFVDLSRADFRRTKITTGLNLRNTAFDHASMQFTRLSYVDLRDCFFLVTDLRGAALFHADLSGASFFRVSLKGADFDSARLDGTEFEKCDLTDAANLTVDQLKAAKIDETTRLPGNVDRQALDQSVPAEVPPPSP